ncbi:MAG: EAL domain-containing protein [Kangiellaceae bacterium]|nr:EAL domain-containing protein [Kangiellaceae bacterium]
MKPNIIPSVVPHYIRSSITLKIVLFVGAAIICLVALQTYISVSQMDKKLTPLVAKELRNSLTNSENIFSIISKQTREDAQIIGSHNALTNYIDYELLEDVNGMNEEVVNLEQFLRSLTGFKTRYQDIEIITSAGSVIHLADGKVAESSELFLQLFQAKTQSSSIGIAKNQLKESAYFTRHNDQILFTLNYLFRGDNYFIDGQGAEVFISITNNITMEVISLTQTLGTDFISLSLQSNDNVIFGKLKNSGSPELLLKESFISDNMDLKLTVYKEKRHAFILIEDMKDASLILAAGTLLVISISLFLTSKFIIEAPLKDIINFINNDVLKLNNLKNRYQTASIDEIGVFSLGLNNMLDQIQYREGELKNSEERLALALWGGDEGMWELEFSSNVMYFDSGSCNILVLGEAPIKKALADFILMIHQGDRPRVSEYIASFPIDSEEVFDAEFRLCTAKDNYLWVQLKGKLNQRNSKSGEQGITGTLRDITEEIRIEQEIQLYATAFNSSNNAITILNTSFHMIAVNKAFSRITGFSAEEAAGRLPHFVKNDESLFCTKDVDEQISTQGYWSGEILGKRKNNDLYVKDMDLNPVYGKQQEITHYVCVFSDITEKKKSERELWNMANYDMLTKLPNRGCFRKNLNTAINRSKGINDSIALLFIDLDKFKQVNDSLGHEAGDELLKKVANLLSQSTRKNDTVARLGGDEFAIILEGINEKNNAEAIAKKIINEFSKGLMVQDKLTGVGASIGISFYPYDAKDTEKLIHCADTAMYSAKMLGSNLYHFYHATMGDHVNRRNLIEQELNIALKEGGLCLYYQPQLDLATGEIVSFEALSRWFHPELGCIAPDEFIPIAEETGLIAELGLNVFNQAAKQLKAWHQQGFSEIKMAVNISPKQFLLTDINLDIANSLKSNGIAAKYLELELTESLIVEDPEKIIGLLHTIKSVGVRLSIDDFGTGYSSLSYLSKFPLDILKIDKSFVQQTETDKRSLALTKAIVGIAHSLDLEVIAEGVETKKQLEIVTELGCHYLQGYYFSAPVSAEEATMLLKNKIGLNR